MKTSLLILATLLSVIALQGQVNPTNVVSQITTNPVQQTALDNAFNAIGIGITNYAIQPYATYAPNAPVKWGGGILGLYNFNQNASAGIGLDWLSSFSLISANLELKAPFHVSTIFPSVSKVPVLGDAIIVPFGLLGVGTPSTGNGHFNGNPMAISDVGGAIRFGHLWGGQFDAGAAWGKWVGQGPYGNVTRYHAFVGYTHGF